MTGDFAPDMAPSFTPGAKSARWPCSGCPLSFDSVVALAVHVAEKHPRPESTSAQLARVTAELEQERARADELGRRLAARLGRLLQLEAELESARAEIRLLKARLAGLSITDRQEPTT